ncbi:aspartate aminotransferase family protein [Xylanibacillus composti]|uniref:Aspartate aminotransferase family protein n=1 Tax=Xylanibacillus composti TaxID=1572762 RepID=A0A8J4H858_9BACL|nr:aspartate aminotransferase family protein [Xylanibacillus composti]MDT9726392.1 aspartate aminotransferase family protein [Xylanibacillus composti]GIQ70368.1 aspartate aminotransferase family protein [Xylanibacillus composti]
MQTVQGYRFLTVEDADAMTEEENLRLFKKHIGQNLGKMLSMLGFADAIPVRAEGMHITLNDGREILDMTGHVGVLVAGHNHPRIIEARRKWGERRGLETWKFFPSPYQGALCHNLSLIFPEDLEIVFFCNSGAEANEGAMKLAQKYAGPERKMVAFTDISFHGKTHATLTVSGSEQHQNHHFNKLENCHMVKYGDFEALRELVESNLIRKGVSRVGTFIVEAIRTEGVVKPDSRYFQQVRQLCDQYDIALIFDEIYTGFGRTGKMFAFEHHGVSPDICSFSKAFGGGKATFAGFITRPSIYNKAYAKMNEATLHSTTYNGYGEEIVSSLEVLQIIQDERLVENSEEMGAYLLHRLEEVQREYSDLVAEVRGVGLLCCIKFKSKTEKLLRMISSTGSEAMEKFVTGAIITKLFQEHNILTFTPPHDSAQLLITPSLIIRKEHVDQFIEALKQVLGSSLWTVGFSYMKKLKG